MTTNSGTVIKSFSCPLNDFKQRQIGTIRTHTYRLKSTAGEESLKTEVKFTHLKTKYISKPPTCSNTNFSLHFTGSLKKVAPQTYSIFCSLY